MSKLRVNSAKGRRFAWFCRLSHKRNSKGFDRSNRPAATSSHDQTTENSWANDRIGIKRERFSADDDQWCGGDVSISEDRKSTRLNSSHITISYAVFCLKKNNGED